MAIKKADLQESKFSEKPDDMIRRLEQLIDRYLQGTTYVEGRRVLVSLGCHPPEDVTKESIRIYEEAGWKILIENSLAVLS